MTLNELRKLIREIIENEIKISPQSAYQKLDTATKKEIKNAIDLWNTRKRRMGCVAGTNWFCRHVKGFKPIRLTRYTKDGEPFEHVVATNGDVQIDFTPYADHPRIDKEDDL